jgi:serine phosphatase RsbU (regulator of sigma subunit)
MNLYNSLGTLESAGLIQLAKVEPDLEYLFSHSMVQDAAYASLLDSDRKRLHLAVGNAIESLYPERKKELAAVLGYHFKEAGQDERALVYFIIAGDAALTVFANKEAEVQYLSALGLMCCSGPQIAHLYSGLGEALYRQNRFVESTEAFRQGIAVHQSLGNDDGVARLYARLGRVAWYAGDRPEGLKLCLEGMALVKDSSPCTGKARLMHETARAYYFNGESEKALPLCRRALQLAEEFGDKYLEADALATLGILAGVEPEESLSSLEKAAQLAEENGFLQVATRAHINLGTMERTWKMDNESALRHYRRSAELGKMRGVVSEEFIALESYVSCLFTPGRLKEVETEMPNLEGLVKQLPDPEPMAVTIDFLKGVLIMYKGDWDKAIAIYRQCLQIYLEQKNQESIFNSLLEVAWILLEKKRWGEPSDLTEAEILISKAIEMVENESSTEKIFAYPYMVILKARQGKPDEATSWMEKSNQRMPERHSTWDDRNLIQSTLEIAAARKDWDRAIEQVEKLVQLDQRLGFRIFHSRNLLSWADLLISRNNPGDLENAQVLLNQALDEYAQMGIGHYPEIARGRLRTIQQRLLAQTLDHEKMTRELKKARLVQESLLPLTPPSLPGWDIQVLFEPAHETSGDFYDFLKLSNGDLGMVIADVTDKGTGAALFMALSRSLWRTFAVDHPDQPELTMTETNRRILSDTHGGLFITLLYAILDPEAGEFSYCSAGHLPALVLREKDGSLEELPRTGMPLGVMEGTQWERVSIKVEPGDAVLLYTDGITEAQNLDEEFFGMGRLRDVFADQRGRKAAEIREAVRSAVRQFVGQAEQFDDITMLVVVRQKE